MTEDGDQPRSTKMQSRPAEIPPIIWKEEPHQGNFPEILACIVTCDQ